MSQENVEVVRRWIEFYNGRDTDGLMQLTTSDYEMKSVFADVESRHLPRLRRLPVRVLQDAG